MAAQGWVRRFAFRTEQGGRNQFVYMLAKDGLAAARDQMSLFGPYATPEAGWREPDVKDPRRALHDLHAVGWLLALCRTLPRGMALGWHRSREPLARPEPRLRGRPGDRRVIEAREVPVDPARAIAEFRLERFVPIHSDGMVELAIDTPRAGGGWTASSSSTGPGSPARTPVSSPPTTPSSQARAFVRAADEQVYFCCERDVHEGRLRAWQLPRLPPDLRLELRQERAPEPQLVELIATELVARARRVR
jgi:hypothetical protein